MTTIAIKRPQLPIQRESQYKNGDWFLDAEAEPYLLAKVTTDKFCLIHVPTGNRFREPGGIADTGIYDNKGFTYVPRLTLDFTPSEA